MQYFFFLCVGFADNFVHPDAFAFFSGFPDVKNADADATATEGDGYHVTDLYVIGRLCIPAINRYAGRVTRLISNRSSLNKSGYLEIFVKPHD